MFSISFPEKMTTKSESESKSESETESQSESENGNEIVYGNESETESDDEKGKQTSWICANSKCNHENNINTPVCAKCKSLPPIKPPDSIATNELPPIPNNDINVNQIGFNNFNQNNNGVNRYPNRFNNGVNGNPNGFNQNNNYGLNGNPNGLRFNVCNNI